MEILDLKEKLLCLQASHENFYNQYVLDMTKINKRLCELEDLRERIYKLEKPKNKVSDKFIAMCAHDIADDLRSAAKNFDNGFYGIGNTIYIDIASSIRHLIEMKERE